MSRVSSRDPFFQRRSEWAKYKHAILGRYLHVWVYKLASRSDELAFVDTCAGEGTYDDGELGSPLLAARWNDDYLNAKGKRLVVYACEPRPASFEKLRLNLDPYLTRNPPQAVVMNERFEDALPDLLEATRHVPTLIFIDPYGMKDLTAGKLAPLLKDKGREPTELIVRVPPQLIRRFVGWLKKKERDARGKKTAASFRRLLDELHLDTEALAQSLEEDPDHSVNIHELLYDYLKLFTMRFSYVQAIPVRPNYYATPKYYLVHGTDSSHGIAHMNDIVSKAEDDLFKETYMAQERGQLSLFDLPQRIVRARIEDAEQMILEYLEQVGEAGYIDIRAQLALRFGPDLRAKDHNKALKNLEGKKISRIDKGGRIEHSRYRLISS